MDFNQFRVTVAKSIRSRGRGPITQHIEKCLQVLENTETEPNCLFTVSMTAPHGAYEEMVDDGCEFEDWWEWQNGYEYLRDWMIDMHQGLCPAEIIDEIDAVMC